MCGRYTLSTFEEFTERPLPFGTGWVRWLREHYKPRYNVAPTDLAPVVTSARPDQPALFRWGLIPSWAKDPSIGNRMINARAETIASKPAFRSAFARRRCLVLADGFYEWKREGRAKQPLRMVPAQGGLWTFAGLWETWTPPGGEKMHSFTILTTEPNDLLKGIHDRMPVILPADAAERWLDPEAEPVELQSYLKPLPDEDVRAYPVSPIVNSPRNDVPECIAPV